MNPLFPFTPELDDELNWLAFRYVSGEMTGDEIDSFEARLARDLAACEAVAEMSNLASCSQQALTAEISELAFQVENPRSMSVRIRAWVAVGSTLAALGWLLMLLTGHNDRSIVESPEAVTQNDAQAAADLIARWTQSDGESGFSDDLPEITPLELSGADDSEKPHIPGWMIAAVSLEKTAPPADDATDMPSQRNAIEVKEN